MDAAASRPLQSAPTIELRPSAAKTSGTIWQHVVVLAIGAAVFFYVLGWDFLAGHTAYWQTPMGDASAERTGYLSFLYDKWRFPIFNVPTANQPEGLNTLFVGGVPLFALIAKIIYTLTGVDLNLLPFWYLLCYALQAHSFYVLLTVCKPGPQYRTTFLVASVLPVISHAFITRFGHISLEAHFLVIYMLALVIRAGRPGISRHRAVALGAMLIVTSALVFSYFAIMNGLLFAALMLQLWRRDGWRVAALPRLIGYGAAAVAFVAAIAVSAGFLWALGHAEPQGLGDFALLSTDPLSFVTPTKGLVFPASELFPTRWEGSFYLGLGVVALLAINVVASPLAALRGLTRQWPLVAVLALIALYALSNRIATGMAAQHLVFSYPLPAWVDAITGQARSSGRLIWPVGYAITAGLIVLTVTRFRHAVATGLICAAVMLSATEFPAMAELARFQSTRAPSMAVSYPDLREMVKGHNFVRVLPSFWCGSQKESLKDLTQAVNFVTNEHGLPSNSGIPARRMKDCSRETQEGAANFLKDGELNVVFGSAIMRGPLAPRLEDAGRHCRTFAAADDTVFICSKSWSEDGKSPISTLLASLAIGQKVEVAPSDAIAPFLGGGWSETEGTHRWSIGSQSSLAFKAPASELPLTLILEFIPFLHPPGGLSERNAHILVNGEVVGNWKTCSGDLQTLSIPIAPGPERAIAVTLKFAESPSPKDVGAGGDIRKLGIALRSFKLHAGQWSSKALC